MYMCVCKCVCICMHVYVMCGCMWSICMYICMYVYACMYVSMGAYVWVCVYVLHYTYHGLCTDKYEHVLKQTKVLHSPTDAPRCEALDPLVAHKPTSPVSSPRRSAPSVSESQDLVYQHNKTFTLILRTYIENFKINPFTVNKDALICQKA